MMYQDDPFEHGAAQFISRLISYVPESLKVLVVASPLSARNSDVCLLWHPHYRTSHTGRIFIRLIAELILGCGKGISKLLSRQGWRYAIYGDVKDTLLVVPDTCGQLDQNSQYRTPYVQTELRDALLVFNLRKYLAGQTRTISAVARRTQIRLAAGLVWAGIRASFGGKGSISDNVLLLLMWSAWCISLQWLEHYYLASAISSTIKDYHLKKLGCVHEMHAYARVVWSMAARYHLKSCTVQHAALGSGKRWYVVYPEEIQSGLMLPDYMYVYYPAVRDDLQGMYSKTKFALGCSTRYAHWKNVMRNRVAGTVYLFVGALARFDNEVIVASLHSLLQDVPDTIPVRLRLHPFAQMSYRSYRWIQKRVQEGSLIVSLDATLQADLEVAKVVIGMSTTVLQEALLLGIPVIQLVHPDYLEYINLDGVSGVLKKDYHTLGLDDLKKAALFSVDSHAMREQLGLLYPVVTYERLFSLS